MCDPVTIAVAATAAVSAGGALIEGQEQKAQLKQVAQAREQEAKEIRRLGFIKENSIRKRNRILAGQQVVDLVSAGLDPTQGTALDLAFETGRTAEMEALTVRADYDGQVNSRLSEADLYRRKAKSAETQSFFKAGTAALKGGGKIAALQ